jgi:hypothetical protein
MAKGTKKRRGPKPTGKGHVVGVRIHPPLMKAIDAFRQEHDAHPSRPEAIRLILADSLTAYGLLPVDEPPPMKRDAN